MENKKIKLLSFKSDNHGVGSFRNVWPAQQIQKDFKDEIDVQLGLLGDHCTMDYLKSFDIIHFHRQLFPTDENLELKIKELKEAGVILVMDIDDYWSPPTTHPMYTAALKEKVAEKTIKYFRLVDYVTTTTDIFANYIKKINPNVHVIPNSLDMEHKMWKDEDTKKTDKVRITYIGGSSHLADLETLIPSMNLLHNDKSLKDKYQMVLCGYDVRGSITQIYPDGHQETRKIFPYETVWNKFEEIFTGNYNPSIVDEDYKKWLLKYKNESYPNKDVYEGNYIRRWTLPLTQYGKHYNYCDICLAPLAENTFNEVKSQLKVVESGLKRKVLIAQDGFLVPKFRSERGWYEYIKKLILDKDLRDKLADNLYNFVIDKYTTKIVTADRVSWYKDIFNERKLKEKESSLLVTNN